MVAVFAIKKIRNNVNITWNICEIFTSEKKVPIFLFFALNISII